MAGPVTDVRAPAAPGFPADGTPSAAYVTDRSGIPRLEVAAVRGGTQGARSDPSLLPAEGHTIVGRNHLVELGGRVAAWFGRWL